MNEKFMLNWMVFKWRFQFLERLLHCIVFHTMWGFFVSIFSVHYKQMELQVKLLWIVDSFFKSSIEYCYCKIYCEWKLNSTVERTFWMLTKCWNEFPLDMGGEFSFVWLKSIDWKESQIENINPSFQTYFAFDSRAEQQMEVYLRYGQHPELYPNRRGEIVQGWVMCKN